MPVLGNILRKIAVARFCRTLSTLISSGVPILDGLEITAKTAGNADHRGRRSWRRARASSAARRSRRRSRRPACFPPMVTQMIGVGEATGALDTMLGEDRRLLRGGSRHGGRRPADAARADHDRVPRRRRRRHRHRDVPADLRPDQQADVGHDRDRAAAERRLAHRHPGGDQHDAARLGDVRAGHGAGVVRRRSVLLPDRAHLRADDRLRADAALRRAAPLAGRPAAGGRRAASSRRSSTSPAASPATSRRSTCCRSSPASTVQFRRGGLLVATLSAVLYGGLVLAQYLAGVGPAAPIRGCAAYAQSLPPRSVARYTVALNVFGFFAVALLERIAGRTACGRRARGSSRRRPRSPTCRRSTSTSSTACRAAWRRPITAQRILTFNRAAEAITGVPCRAAVGRADRRRAAAAAR